MKERPILFSGPMVRAILDGCKSQTRRIVKPKPPSVEAVRKISGSDFHLFDDTNGRDPFRAVGPVWAVSQLMGLAPGPGPKWPCPYGSVGDRLWVRETFHLAGGGNVPIYRANWREDAKARGLENIPSQEPRWRPSIFMPRWASRLTLEVTDLRVQRLIEISQQDAQAEGAHYDPAKGWTHDPADDYFPIDARSSYKRLWDRINGKDSWWTNPCVWVVTFKRVLQAARSAAA